MKTTLIWIFTLLISLSSHSQNFSALNDQISFKSIFGLEKTPYVKSFIQDKNDNGTFWVLYDLYEEERMKIAEARSELFMVYIEDDVNLTDENMAIFIARISKLNKKNDQLISKYYKKLRKSADFKTALQFYQLEKYFLSLIDGTILRVEMNPEDSAALNY